MQRFLAAIVIFLAGVLRADVVLAQRILSVAPSLNRAEGRVALVVGNSAYKVTPLQNPVNDAADIAVALQSLGFEVILKRDADRLQMRQALRQFGEALRTANVGLFYFAGHGVQSRGNNYLIPVDADIRTEADVEDLAVDASYALRIMEESQVKVSIVILDACRNNPYRSGFRSASRGLAQMTAATGTLIAFSTSPGSVAADGTGGRNGTYTKRLLESLQEPDTDVLKVFQRVRAAVVQETAGQQVPWEATSLIGDFYFAGRPASGSVTAAISNDAIELAYWEAIKASSNRNEFIAYLKQYPSGRFAVLARSKLFHVVDAEFSETGKLKVNDLVTAAGVRVGSVGAIANGQSGGMRTVTLHINRDYRFPRDTLAKIHTQPNSGQTYVALEPGGAQSYLVSGDQLKATQDAFTPDHPSYRGVSETMKRWSEVAVKNRVPLELLLLYVLRDQEGRVDIADALRTFQSDEKSGRGATDSVSLWRSLEQRRPGRAVPRSTITARFSGVGTLPEGATVIDLQTGSPLGRVSRVALDNDTYEAVVEMYVDLETAELASDSLAMILTDPIANRPFIGIRNGAARARLKTGDQLRMTISAADDLAPQIEHWLSQREKMPARR